MEKEDPDNDEEAVALLNKANSAQVEEVKVEEEAHSPPKNVVKGELLGKEDYALPKSESQMPTQSTRGDDTTPLVLGAWLNNRDITTWLTDKLYHLEVDEPRESTLLATFILSLLCKMRAYEHGQTSFGAGLGWWQQRKGLYWFLGICLCICSVDLGTIGWDLFCANQW